MNIDQTNTHNLSCETMIDNYPILGNNYESQYEAIFGGCSLRIGRVMANLEMSTLLLLSIRHNTYKKQFWTLCSFKNLTYFC